MIQKYRKQSAEWMGYKLIIREPSGPNRLEYENGEWIWEHDWRPNQDYNQIAMIEDKLYEEGRTVVQYNTKNLHSCLIEKWNGDELGYCVNKKDKRIAFMKAFMEYIKTK